MSSSSAAKVCFACASPDVVQGTKYCRPHLKDAEAWLAEEKRLDNEELARTTYGNRGADERQSVGEYLAEVGWDSYEEAQTEAETELEAELEPVDVEEAP